jgi:site-specific recombinase XerD
MRLLEQVRGVLRAKHYAYRTEQCYVQWILRYIRFHGIKHPNTMGTSEIEQFLTHLATHDKVAASTQNQALGALLLLYRDVLKMEVGKLNAVRARRPVMEKAATRVRSPLD